jgi:hypothetical protein
LSKLGEEHAVLLKTMSYPLLLVTAPPLPVALRPLTVVQAFPFPRVTLAHTNNGKLVWLAGISLALPSVIVDW